MFNIFLSIKFNLKSDRSIYERLPCAHVFIGSTLDVVVVVGWLLDAANV